MRTRRRQIDGGDAAAARRRGTWARAWMMAFISRSCSRCIRLPALSSALRRSAAALRFARAVRCSVAASRRALKRSRRASCTASFFMARPLREASELARTRVAFAAAPSSRETRLWKRCAAAFGVVSDVAATWSATWRRRGQRRGGDVASDVAATWSATWRRRGQRRGDDVAQNGPAFSLWSVRWHGVARRDDDVAMTKRKTDLHGVLRGLKPQRELPLLLALAALCEGPATLRPRLVCLGLCGLVRAPHGVLAPELGLHDQRGVTCQ